MFHDVVACSGGCGKVIDKPGQEQWICTDCAEENTANVACTCGGTMKYEVEAQPFMDNVEYFEQFRCVDCDKVESFFTVEDRLEQYAYWGKVVWGLDA